MRTLFNKILAAGLLLCIPSIGFAQIKSKTPFWDSELMEPVAITLVSVIILLLLAIGVMSKVLFTAIQSFRSKIIEGHPIYNMPKGSSTLLLILLVAVPAVIFANNMSGPDESGMIAGISATSFYVLMSIVLLQVIILFLLVMMFKNFAQLRRPMSSEEVMKREQRKKLTWFERMNKTKSFDKKTEEAIALNHDYDGIVELDNPTPPWWNWLFILSVVYAVVYLWVLHVSKSVPMQIERLEIAYEKAEIAKQVYIEKMGAALDENSVVFLDNEADLSAGKQIFADVCAACHGPQGQGGVGANLVDDYWIHGGSVKDIFSLIKYGALEKGMPSWQDQYSPLQIAQVTSYIVSIRGSDVESGKEPEGTLYVPEEEGATDSDDEGSENEEEDAESSTDVAFHNVYE